MVPTLAGLTPGGWFSLWRVRQLAVEEEHLKAVETLLAAHADVTMRDVDGCSALHWAAEIGNTEVRSRME